MEIHKIYLKRFVKQKIIDYQNILAKLSILLP